MVRTWSAGGMPVSRRTALVVAVTAVSRGRVARAKARSGGTSHSAARSGLARARFFGTISPRMMWPETTSARAKAKATGWVRPAGRPTARTRGRRAWAMAGSPSAPKPSEGDGDAELGAGKHGGDRPHRDQDRACPAGAAAGERLDLGAARGDERELGADEEPVHGEQDHDADHFESAAASCSASGLSYSGPIGLLGWAKAGSSGSTSIIVSSEA